MPLNIPKIPRRHRTSSVGARPPAGHSPVTDEPVQKALQCFDCGGQRTFDPNLGGLTCESCGGFELLAQNDPRAAQREFPFDPTTPHVERPSPSPGQEHRCRGCGGTVLFSGTALSERCPYCNGPMVLAPVQPGYDAMALIPFGLNEKDARDVALRWCAQRIGAPSRFAGHVGKTARGAGLYAPFWTFDTEERLSWIAREVRTNGKRVKFRDYAGEELISFDDLLVPASPHVSPLIRDSIMRAFDPTKLCKFDPRYLAGFAAERHHLSVAEGFRANTEDKRTQTKSKLRQRAPIPANASLTYRTDALGVRYRRILLPVWIFHYEHDGRAMKIVVSGIDTRTFGERPFSKWKLGLMSGAISFLVVLSGLILGMSL